jgi:two-component system chemotaxis response regulator CheB
MDTTRVVVVGASAGGVAALEQLVSGIPSDFAAPVLIVLHIAAGQKPLLPRILSTAGPLPVIEAVSGERLRGGQIYVAPADYHLLVTPDHVAVTRGPKENDFRPSVDVLFRSAAYHFGTRTIGVVLSGLVSDGSSGLYAIKRLGGIAVVQDPAQALYDSMPLSALGRVDIDYALPAGEIGRLLAGLLEEPLAPEPLDAAHYRAELKYDLDVSASGASLAPAVASAREPSMYTCPECGGVLHTIEEGRTQRFRCHTGHGYTKEALLEDCTRSVESSLWEAVRRLHETTVLLNETAEELGARGDEQAAKTLRYKARQLKARTESVRSIALARPGLDDAMYPPAP